MNDAKRREKVIRGLECCLSPNDHENCPYDGIGKTYSHCLKQLVTDAFDLLKEQEPRVLEYSEIEKYPLVWLEDEDKEDVIPGLFLQYNWGEAEFSVQDPDEYVESIVRAATVIAFEKTYNVRWRAWTAKPTQDQRLEVPWE